MIRALQLYPQRVALLSAILRDYDSSIAFCRHLRQWQDMSDPIKYQMIQEAMGQRFKSTPIPNRTLRKWLHVYGYL